MEFQKKQKGWHLSIHYAETEQGDCPAAEYLEKLPKNIKAKFLGLITLVAMNGQLRDETKFKKLEDSGDIWEFKHKSQKDTCRLYCFFHKDQLVLTHGSEKKKDKGLAREIKYAQTLKKIYEGKKP